MGRRFSKEDFYNERFYQLSKELFKGKYRKMSNNDRVIYSVLKDRFELSIVNEWVDENNDIYFYFDQNQLAEECCISLKTVQRCMKVLSENALIDTVRQGINLPNRLYLLKPEMQEKESANTDRKRIGQNDLSGSVKTSYPDESKSPTIYTEKNKTKNSISSSRADMEGTVKEDDNLSYEFISYDGTAEKISGKEDIYKYIDEKTNIENDGLSSKLCQRVRDILYQICNPFDKGIRQFRADGRIIELDISMRKQMYCHVSPELFIDLVQAIQNNPEPIKSLKAFVTACLYNHTNYNRSVRGKRASPSNHFNDMMKSEYDFKQIEHEFSGIS